MMYRSARIWFLLAAGALLASCNPHEFPTGEGDPAQDFSVRLVFEEDMESLTVDGQPATKAGRASLGYRYAVQLFRYHGESQFGLTPDYTYEFTRRSNVVALDTTLYLAIDPVKYQVYTWVDRLDEAGEPFYDASDFEDIRIGADYTAGATARDAFVGQTDLDLSGRYVAGDRLQRTLHLVRPVAQLRFVAPEALTFLSYTGGVGSDRMQAELRYKEPVQDGYNLFRDRTLATREGASVTMRPELDASGELVFCSDFVFAPAGQDGTVDVEFRLTDLEGNPISSFSGEVPVRRGWTTTVTFAIPDLGGGNKTSGIGINPGFDDEIEIQL